MTDDNTPRGDETEDDTYVLEDTGATVEDIEREMERVAEEAAEATDANDAPAPQPAAAPASAETTEWRDRYMRTLADFENFRKRQEREKTEYQKYALAGPFRDILPVLDNFDRALEHAGEGDEFHKGVHLIYKQLYDVLQRNGLKAIEETGVHFDPNIHEGVIREEDASVPSHTVVAVLQKGYFLHDRLLRPAMVKVAVGGPEGDVH